MAEEIKQSGSFYKYAFFIILAALIVGAFVFFNQNKQTPTNTGNDGTGRVNVSIGDDAVLGSPTAKVTIIEFSDYQCIFCRKFYADTFTQLKKDYIDTGKAKFVFRDFPIEQIHPASMIAAQATECMRAQYGEDAYWKMADKIFSEQNAVDPSATRTISFDIYELEKWANEVGYDITPCLTNQTYRSEVITDIDAGQKAGVKGTPSFFINGKFIEGAQPYSVFKQAIDSEL